MKTKEWSWEEFKPPFTKTEVFSHFSKIPPPTFISWRVWAPSSQIPRKQTAGLHSRLPGQYHMGLQYLGTIWRAFYCACCWLLIWAPDKFAKFSSATCWWKMKTANLHTTYFTNWLASTTNLRSIHGENIFPQNLGCDFDQFYAWNLDRFDHQRVWRISPFNVSPL